MYVNSGYMNNSRVPFIDKKNPLVVASCGTYQLRTRSTLPTLRPKGRIDYQIIYIASGKAHFYFDNQEESQVVTAGNIVLYKPKEMQKYIYYAQDNPEVYWVHFTGYEVKNLLRKYGFNMNDRVFHVGSSQDYFNIFQNLISELKMHKNNYRDMVSMLFQQMLILMQRYIDSDTDGVSHMPDVISKACQFFQKNYRQEIAIENYAKEIHFSTCWFIRTFKQHTGMSPLHYITKIRMSNAQHLLKNTSYSIAEIANIVGYDNPLYFSRVFKKYVGLPPTQYRKK